MYHFQTTTWYKIIIACLKSYCYEFIFIQSLNNHFKKSHFQTILKNLNLFTLCIFCLNEIQIQNIPTHQEISNVISKKFNISSCYNGHGIMIL